MAISSTHEIGRDAPGSATADLAGKVRELTVLHTGLVELMEERDRRYEERFTAQQKAVDAALAAAEKLVSAAFAASEKAIQKAEVAQQDYNVRSNEFRGQLDDQAKTLMPRQECNVRFDAFDKDIAALRDWRNIGEGREVQGTKGSESNRYLIGLAVTVINVLIALGTVFMFRSTP